jgi:hypothetical protein
VNIETRLGLNDDEPEPPESEPPAPSPGAPQP